MLIIVYRLPDVIVGDIILFGHIELLFILYSQPIIGADIIAGNIYLLNRQIPVIEDWWPIMIGVNDGWTYLIGVDIFFFIAYRGLGQAISLSIV